jgi:hypothetical protein
MSKLQDWIDECFSKELKNVPHKPKDAINVIVYDKTEVPPPGADTIGDRVKVLFNDPKSSLTFWWKLGAFLDKALGFTDYIVPAASWDEAFAGIQDAVARQAAKTGRPVRIASLQSWGHGAPGHVFMGPAPALTAATLNPGGRFHEQARAVASLMHSTEGHVWFRCCSPFQGARGQELARVASTIFRVPAVGHTFTIHALQSGTRVLEPGARPDWDVDEGIHKRGKKEGQAQISSPLRVRTVTMFRLYPPMDEGKIILPAGLSAAVARGISRISD